MAIYTLTIPGWLPVSTNKLLGSHWAVARKMKANDAAIVRLHAMEQKIPDAKTRRSVTATYRRKKQGGRLPDLDNLFKSLLDALKQAYLIVDDSAKWCELATPTLETGDRTETVIELTDLPPA